jgi:hypothetical protein
VHWPSKPHTNGTPGHWEAIQEQVEKMIKSGLYKEIYVNKGINLGTGLNLSPNRRPDVFGIRLDGKIDLFEIPSKTDTVAALEARMLEVLKKLGTQAGKRKIVHIQPRHLK